MKTIKLILALLFSLALAACGGGGGGGGGMSPPAAHIAGVWSLQNTTGNNNCGDPTGVVSYNSGTISHTDGSNTLTYSSVIEGSNRTLSGTISGSAVTISGSYPSLAGGTINMTLNGTLNSAANPMTFSGTTTWTWSDGTSSCSGTDSVVAILTTPAGGGTTTIPAMPYNGSVTGTADGFYQYTTVGSVDTISLSGMTSDLDPKVYTDSTFVTLDSNWACTVKTGTLTDSCTATTPVTAGTILYIKVRNFAGLSSPFTLSVSGPPVAGSTLTTTFGSITGISHIAALNNITATRADLYFMNGAGDGFMMIYQTDATRDILSVVISNGASGYYAGTTISNIICHVSGTNTMAYPLCTSWGITVSKAAGTISFASTPIIDVSTSANGTMSGSFTFTPF